MKPYDLRLFGFKLAETQKRLIDFMTCVNSTTEYSMKVQMLDLKNSIEKVLENDDEPSG